MSRFLSLLLVLQCLSVSSLADEAGHEPVVIVGFPKEGRLEKDGTGHYADLVHALIEGNKQPAIFGIRPIRRVIRDFESGGSICMVPTAFERWKHFIPSLTPENVLESEPIDYVTAHVITRAGEAPISDVRDLAGKRVSYWVGVPVSAFMTGVDTEAIAAESEESNIRLLMSGRVDAIFSWVPDAYILYDKMGLGTPNLVEDDPIFGSAAHILCRKTPATQSLIKEINKGIIRMREDGKLKQLLGRHSRVVGVDVPLNMVENQ